MQYNVHLTRAVYPGILYTCKAYENSRERDRDRQTDRDRETETETDRQTGRQAGRQTEIIRLHSSCRIPVLHQLVFRK